MNLTGFFFTFFIVATGKFKIVRVVYIILPLNSTGQGSSTPSCACLVLPPLTQFTSLTSSQLPSPLTQRALATLASLFPHQPQEHFCLRSTFSPSWGESQTLFLGICVSNFLISSNSAHTSPF